jgi:hypothetical protein
MAKRPRSAFSLQAVPAELLDVIEAYVVMDATQLRDLFAWFSTTRTTWSRWLVGINPSHPIVENVANKALRALYNNVYRLFTQSVHQRHRQEQRLVTEAWDVRWIARQVLTFVRQQALNKLGWGIIGFENTVPTYGLFIQMRLDDIYTNNPYDSTPRTIFDDNDRLLVASTILTNNFGWMLVWGDRVRGERLDCWVVSSGLFCRQVTRPQTQTVGGGWLTPTNVTAGSWVTRLT